MGNRCPGREGQTNPTAVITGPVIVYIPDQNPNTFVELTYTMSGESSTAGSSPIVKYEWEAGTGNGTNTAQFEPKAEGPTYTITVKRGQVIKDVILTLIVTDENGLCATTNTRLNLGPG